VAEARHATGPALLAAIALGLEAVVRVGAGMRYPAMRARGWHSPGVIGPFGGATATASLMGPDAVTAGLGTDWRLAEISLRLWPAASSIQSVVTALLALIEAQDIRPAGIERVVVGLSRTAYDMHGSLPWGIRFRALLSTPYVTGVVLHDRRCWFDQFTTERLADPALDAFVRGRIVVGVDPSAEVLTHRDGGLLHAYSDASTGSSRRSRCGSGPAARRSSPRRPRPST
jgi:2-methylcitrate dehydratase PrpD